MNSGGIYQQVKFTDDKFLHILITRIIYFFYVGLICLQRNLNLLHWELLKGHEEFIGFVHINSQSYEVETTFTKPFPGNYNLELVAPINEADFT